MKIVPYFSACMHDGFSCASVHMSVSNSLCRYMHKCKPTLLALDLSILVLCQRKNKTSQNLPIIALLSIDTALSTVHVICKSLSGCTREQRFCDRFVGLHLGRGAIGHLLGWRLALPRVIELHGRSFTFRPIRG